MTHTADVIIIGSGIMGSSAAYYLAKQGVTNVLVLEESRNIGDGASSRNGAGVRLSSRVLSEHRFAEDAILNIWPTLSEELDVDTEYERIGSLSLALTEKQQSAIESGVKMNQEKGIEIEMLTGDEVRSMCPAFSPDIIAASFCQIDGVANPMATTLGFYLQARRLGVRFISGEKAIEIQKHKGRADTVITAAGNAYQGQKIILAAGIDSRPIAQSVGLDIPVLRRVDECIITEGIAPLVPYRFSIPEGTFYSHQTKHGSFIFGGNTDKERYEKAYREKARNTTVATPDKCRGGVRYVPALANVKIVRQWAGWLDSCVDKLPVIQETEEVPGLILAFGFSGHGFAIGPAVGRVLSDLAMDKPARVDISSFQYNRFKARGC